jgi:hypothetical protein
MEENTYIRPVTVQLPGSIAERVRRKPQRQVPKGMLEREMVQISE